MKSEISNLNYCNCHNCITINCPSGIRVVAGVKELEHRYQMLVKELELLNSISSDANVAYGKVNKLLSEKLTTAEAALAAAKAEVAALRKDAARLDWMDTVDCGIDHIGYGNYRHYIGIGFAGTIRDGIDAARMAKEPK